VRKSSSLENIAAGSWEAAIDDVLRAARRDVGVEVEGERPDEVPDDEESLISTSTRFASAALHSCADPS
jgi:hypothetical protein